MKETEITPEEDDDYMTIDDRKMGIIINLNNSFKHDFQNLNRQQSFKKKDVKIKTTVSQSLPSPSASIQSNLSASYVKNKSRLLLLIKGYMVSLVMSAAFLVLFLLAVFSILTHKNDNFVFSLVIFLTLMLTGLIKQPISWIGVIKMKIYLIYTIILLDLGLCVVSVVSLVMCYHYAVVANMVTVLLDFILVSFIASDIQSIQKKRLKQSESLNKSCGSNSSKISRTERNSHKNQIV